MKQLIMEKESTWDGTLSANEFQVAAKAFAEKWKSCMSLPAWTWKPFTRLPYTLSNEEGGYLTLEGVYHHLSKEESCSIDIYGEVEDAATLVQNHDMETHSYDFHIIYSASFRVPMLYFRGHNMDGQPLGWDSMKADIPESSAKMLDEFRWIYITQEEKKVGDVSPLFAYCQFVLSVHRVTLSRYMEIMVMPLASQVHLTGAG